MPTLLARLYARPVLPLASLLALVLVGLYLGSTRSTAPFSNDYATAYPFSGGGSEGESSSSSSWSSWSSLGWRPSATAPRYSPGRLGHNLVKLHRRYLADSPRQSDWLGILKSGDSKTEDYGLFSLFDAGDEESCNGWEPPQPAPSQGGCKRARAWHQLDRLMADGLPSGLTIWPSIERRNTQHLRRLKRCLAVDPQQLPEYSSKSPESGAATLEDTSEGSTWLEDRECSQTASRVLLGHWWYFTLAYGDPSQNPGESVWIRSQIEALEEMGYTVLCVNGYRDMIDLHAKIPDVVTSIWTEDKHMLSCQGDPRCSRWEDFLPSTESYPSLKVLKDGTADWSEEGGVPTDAEIHPRRKWVWSRQELDDLPVEQRGTIPQHKLFVVTYWGARPGDPYWQFPDDREFAWNSLGQQWTLAPFAYPHHTYLPYSIESTCEAVPFVPAHEKKNQAFILAKRTDYFWYRSSVPTEFWPRLEAETGLTAMSVAIDDVRQPGEKDLPVPEGVTSIGHVSKSTFERVVGESRVMLGIGRPLISPSVYSALCQGTPVILPYFGDEAVPKGWDLFNGNLAMHGPAAAIGPPYVYSYKKEDMQQFVSVIKQALDTPIDRYIPEDMTRSSEMKNLDDLMRFDWGKHADLIRVANDVRHSAIRRKVIGRCFEIGRCEPLEA